MGTRDARVRVLYAPCGGTACVWWYIGVNVVFNASERR